jgi:alpha-L-fucosidase 2
MEDVDDSTDRHRHNSHMFAVHPGKQITPLSTPQFANAAIRSLDSRGTQSTGWSSAWKMNIWARLFQNEKAYDQFKSLFRVAKENGGIEVAADGGLYKNLFSAYPPFQMDANFGYTSGVAEMLLQSHIDVIHLLPALPGKWSNGKITGLKARGNVEISMEWSANTLTRAKVRPALTGVYTLLYKTIVKKMSLAGGKEYHFDGQLETIPFK